MIYLLQNFCNELYNGCHFFNVEYHKNKSRRYGVKYTKEILLALEQAMKMSKSMDKNSATGVCTEAFKSQIRNNNVKKDFFSHIYSNLSHTQQEIADRLLLTVSLPFEDTWRSGSDLVIKSLFPPLVFAKGGKQIFIKETTANTGDASALPSVTRYYLSDDPVIDPAADKFIGERLVPLLEAGGSSNIEKYEILLPEDLLAGPYYVGACADTTNAVEELNEINNCYLVDEGVILGFGMMSR